MALAGIVAPACSDEPDDLFPNPGPQVPENFSPAPGGLRRLLGWQYVNSVRVLLGEAGAQAATPPPDGSLHGYDSIAAAELSLPASAVATYEASARAIGVAAATDPATLSGILPCAPAGPADAGCHRQFVTSFGRLAWRRALEAPEVDRITGIAQAASTAYTDFNAGVAYAISALLQSPNFLYMVEIGEPGDGDVRRLTGHEVATRLSFFLLDTTPDGALLDAADAGALETGDGVRAAARDLLARPGAREALRGFYGEFLKLRDIDAVVKDPGAFPMFSPTLGQAMREETLRVIDDVVWERDADYREIVSADFTFVNPELAALYGVPAPASGDFERVTIPPEQGRAGLLGQASFLTLFAHATTTSPTLRGKFVRERLLCQSIPAPPNNVVTELPDDSEAKTMREKLAVHQENPSCAGCHVLMDNIGFALEHFDGIGAFRETENGAPIDATGSIEGVGAFDGERELSAALAAGPDVPACVVKNLFRHATGHVETSGEEGAIDDLAASFEGSGYRMQDLLVELVSSDAFRLVGPLE
jgi:hypothetical protein